MAKIEHIKNKRGEVIYPVSKEGAIYDENGVLLSTKIATFITRLVDNLANYYLKSETYTKGEVDNLIGAIQGFTYIVVSELPTASAETMGIVYLVPSEDPQTQNVKDEYITIRSGVEGSYTYSWEQIGSTAIDLSGYVTTEALNTALADYTTTANLTTLLAAKQDTIADLSTIRSGAAAGATAYQKPASGVPASDMASGVQTSLGKADTAYQKPGTGIPATDMASGVQTSLGKADSAYQKPSGGIPKTDLESGVQGSLELADSAVQADPIGSIVPPVDPSEFATKEEVEGLEAKVDDLFVLQEYQATIQGFVKNDGSIQTNDGYYRTDYIDITGVSKIHLINGIIYSIGCEVAFFTSAKAFISGISIVGDGGTHSRWIDITGNDYATAKYVVISTINNSATKAQTLDYSSLEGTLEGEIGTVNSKTLLDVNTVPNIQGYVNGSGNIATADGYWRTDYIDIADYTELSAYTIIYSAFYAIAFFDENKVFIPELSTKGDGGWMTFNILLNDSYKIAKYVIISTINNELSFISVKSANSVIEPLDEKIDTKLDRAVYAKKFSEDSSFVATIQGFIRADGTIATNEGYYRTDFINLEGFDRLFVKTIIYYIGCDIAFFDKDRNFLPGISIVGDQGSNTYNIDLSGALYANAKYVVVSTINQSYTILQLSSYYSLAHDLRLVPAINHINILVFGDSITHAASVVINEDYETVSYGWDANNDNGKPWVHLVSDYLGAFDVRDYAKHGASFVDQDGTLLSLSNQLRTAINDIPNPNNVFPTVGNYVPDIVIFAIGTNDVMPTDTYDIAISKTVYDGSGDVDIPATLANLDRSKLNQAIRYAFLLAKSTFPYSMMMCVLPIQRAGSANDFTTGVLHDTIKKMANRYSIKVIDGAFELGITADLEKVNAPGVLLFDGLHPNALGRNAYARMMLNAIKTNYVNESFMNE